MGGHDLMSAATSRICTVSPGIAGRVARIRAVVSTRAGGRTARTTRMHYARASELTGSAGGSHIGPAVVYRSKL